MPVLVMPGLINLDFADIRTVMSEMGKAMMGTGEAEGDNRAIEAAEAAISNPLLDDISMKGARGVLINITGGPDMTLFEVDEAANRIREEVDGDANIIFGSTFNDDLQGKMRVSVVATGIDGAEGIANSGFDFKASSNSSNNSFAPAKDKQNARFIPPKPAEAAPEPESVSSVAASNAAQTNVAAFPAEKVVTARQQFGSKKGGGGNSKKGGSFFERAARSFGLMEEEERRPQPQRPQQNQRPDRVKLDSDDDYYEIPAYMRRKNGQGE